MSYQSSDQLKMEFSGFIEVLSEKQINLLKDILKNQGFAECKVTVEAVGKKGDNYSSTVVRVIAENDAGKTLQMVAKISPTEEGIRQKMNSDKIFNNEIIMYERVLPKLLALQKSAGIPEGDLLRYPKYYGAITEAPEEFIVLEDLKVSGFDIRNRMTSLNDEEVKTVLKNLAAYHAAVYALKHNEPELFDKFKYELVDIWSEQEKDLETKVAFAQMEEGLLALFDTDEQRSHLQGILADMLAKISALRMSDLESKYTTLIQGDCWTNNIMFRCEEEKSLDSINIDYQMSRAAPPAQELLYFVFNCTDYETRTKHYHDWLDYYHKMLENYLFNYNLRVSEVYPRERLDTDLRKHARVMMGLSILLACFLTRESEETADPADFEKNLASGDFLGMQNVKEQSMMRMKKRMQGLWDSYTAFGYISK